MNQKNHCLDEQKLAEILAATFRGTNEEVMNSTNILSSCFFAPNFLDILFSLIKNINFSVAIRQAAVIQIGIYIAQMDKINQNVNLLDFFIHFSDAIQCSSIDLTRILRRCSNLFFVYRKMPNSGELITNLFLANQCKASLFLANSYMKIIATASHETISSYCSFTPNYLDLIKNVFSMPIQEELISLAFNFIARATTYLLPENLHDETQFSFWMPHNMENMVQYDTFHYLQFLSNVPIHYQKVCVPSYICDFAKYICTNSNEKRCVAMSMKIIYKMVDKGLVQIDQNYFCEILFHAILPQLTSDSIIEDNHPKSSTCWKDPHDAAIILFESIINRFPECVNIFYSLFQSNSFQCENFVSALDLCSFVIKVLYKFNNDNFSSFLQQLVLCFASPISNVRSVTFKLFSKIDSGFKLSTGLLVTTIFQALGNLEDQDSQVRYFSALSLSALISLIEYKDLINHIYSNTPILSKMDNLFMIFIELEKEYQTQMLALSIKKLINFFGPNIKPLLFPISKEVIDFFYFFASSKENREPYVLFSSVLCNLIKIADGDQQFTSFMLNSIFDPNHLSLIQGSSYDFLFEIVNNIIFYSKLFENDFWQIVPYLFTYVSNNPMANFADISPVLEMLIWKNQKDNNCSNETLTNSLVQFIQECTNPNEWAEAVSVFTKIITPLNSSFCNYIYTKMIHFLKSEQGVQKSAFYQVIEYFFSNYINSISQNDSNDLTDVYLEYAQFPSFVDSVLKCFQDLPDNTKVLAIHASIKIINHDYFKEKSEEDEDDDFSDDDDNDDEENGRLLKPQWFDINSILNNFVYLCKAITESTSQFPRKDILIKFISKFPKTD